MFQLSTQEKLKETEGWSRTIRWQQGGDKVVIIPLQKQPNETEEKKRNLDQSELVKKAGQSE